MMSSLRVIVPVYNDWVSFSRLLQELDNVAATLSVRMFVSAVNDGSTEPSDEILANLPNFQHLAAAEVVHLALNVGHQRAIAIGLCVTVKDDDAEAVLVMDADGEDPPERISELLSAAAGREDFCVVAQRRRRQESLTFRFYYMLYKAAFRSVTGRVINFGNFSLFSKTYARRLVMVPDLWNNLPAAVLRSRLPFTSVPIDRGTRYAGKSKMSFTSLIIHGMSGISVYAEVIFIRLFLLSLILMAISILSVVTVFTLRLFFPLHATPGWATTVTFGMIIIVLQVLFTALSSILMLLNSRVQRLVIPLLDFSLYVASRELIGGQPDYK